MAEIVFLAALVLLASALQGFVGFGFGLALMSVLPLFLPITTATTLVSFAATFIESYTLWWNRKNIDLKVTIFPIVGSLLFIPLGVLFLRYLDEEVLKTFLGLLLILISAFYLLKGDQQIYIKPTKINGIVVGAVAGILNGSLSIGGPPLVLYFVHATENKFRYKAAMDLTFLVTTVYRLIWLIFYGNLTAEMGTILSAAVVAGILGTILGFSLLIKVKRTVIMKTIYIVMILAGIGIFFFS